MTAGRHGVAPAGGGLGSTIVPDGHVRSLTEAELADLRATEGAATAERHGRHWASIFPGFFQPVNLVSRFTAAELSRPTARCWGYRAALAPEDAALANGSVPVHYAALDRLETGGMAHGRVEDLRKCRKIAELSLCRDPEAFEREGYAVYRSAQDRLHYWVDLDEAGYRAMIRARVTDPRRHFVVARLDGVIGGYLESYIVDGVVYMQDLIVASEFLKSGISTGLYVDTIEMGLRAGAVTGACLGLETPERPGLTRFKASLGFPMVDLPARHAIAAPLRAVVRRLRPWPYYRLVGTPPGGTPPGDLEGVA